MMIKDEATDRGGWTGGPGGLAMRTMPPRSIVQLLLVSLAAGSVVRADDDLSFPTIDLPSTHTIAAIEAHMLSVQPICDRLHAAARYEAAFACRMEYNRCIDAICGGGVLMRTCQYLRTDLRDELLLAPRLVDFKTLRTLRAAAASEGSGLIVPLQPPPVLMVGMLRSGSSLLEQMLDMHESVVGLGETSAMADAADIVRRAARAPTVGHPRVIDALLQPGGIASLQRGYLDRHRHKFNGTDGRYDNTATPNQSGSSDDELARHGVAVAVGRASYFVDKDVMFNGAHLWLAATSLPGARVMALSRDPRDVALSLLTRGFAWAPLRSPLSLAQVVVRDDVV